MKKLIIILISVAASVAGKAQQKQVNFYKDAQGQPFVYSVFDTHTNISPGLTVDSSTTHVDLARQNIPLSQSLSGYFILEGTKKINLFAFIPGNDWKNYRFNLIQDDSIFLATNAMPVGRFESAKQGHKTAINFGDHNVADKKLTLEIYKITDQHKVTAISIYNKPLKPIKFGVALVVNNIKRGIIMNPLKDGDSFKIHDDKETVHYIRLSTTQTGLVFLYNVSIKNLSTGKTLPFSSNWDYSYRMDNSKIASAELKIQTPFFEEPGNYQITVTPNTYGGSFLNKAATFYFKVSKPDTAISLTLVVIGFISIVCLCALMFAIVNRYNRIKLAEQQKQKEIVQIQLSAVRSQLNPHFLFNALSGIQNLINNNEADRANRYLSKFARLTRNVLNSNELISIAEEVKLLDDYLQMEQLRFDFIYSIDIDKSSEISNAEIPAMLLQPFVENAVKHGIVGNNSSEIKISIKRKQKDIELMVTDNGKGFDPEKQTSGLGLSLSKRRINLLNEINKETPVLLNIESDNQHTTIKVTLTRWL